MLAALLAPAGITTCDDSLLAAIGRGWAGDTAMAGDCTVAAGAAGTVPAGGGAIPLPRSTAGAAAAACAIGDGCAGTTSPAADSGGATTAAGTLGCVATTGTSPVTGGIVTITGSGNTGGKGKDCGTLAGSAGGATMANCGAAPPAFTCNCSIVPGGSACGSCALTTASPMRSAVSPSAVLPSTNASSTCPGCNATVGAAARATASCASD